MKDNLSIIITMLVFVVLIVIFPLYNYFERQDDMSYNLILKATTNFVDEIINSGYIDQELYDKYIQELAVTGNLFDIQLEAHKKVYTKDPYNTASDSYIEQYLVDYNADIFNTETGATKDSNVKIDNKVLKNGAYYLNVGDQIYVKLRNTNTTMAGAIFNVIVPTSKTDRLAVNYGGIIKNNAWEKQDISNLFQKDIFVDIRLDETTPGFETKISGMRTYALDEKFQVNYIIKVLNYAPTFEDKIANGLKEKLKLTGFISERFITPTSVSKITQNEWRATFNLSNITDVPNYFGADFYKTCKVVLEAEALQGNYFKNETVTDDESIIVKRTNVQGNIPNISGPFVSGNPVSTVELGSTVTYEVDYYDAILLVGQNEFQSKITLDNFTADNTTVQFKPSDKKIIITFTNVTGNPTEKFKIKIASNWSQYFDVKQGVSVKIGEITSNETTLKFTTKSYNVVGRYEYIIPVTGKYRLTVIGANGAGNTDYSGNRGSRGGRGGLSRGVRTFNKGDVIYIYVGGAGKLATSGSSGTGGYNGGGNGSRYPSTHESFKYSYGGGGGGATDIRLSNDNLASRIIVAGGGGGADDIDYNGNGYSGTLADHNDGSGGTGGGANLPGGYGFSNGTITGGAQPGTLTSGFSLGNGQNATASIDLGGGGGGYYGGYAASATGNNGGGGGGSGYVATGFTDVFGQNGVNDSTTGNGKATIEYVGK